MSATVTSWVKKRTLWELFSMVTVLVMLLAYVLYWYSQQPGTRHYWCWLLLVATLGTRSEDCSRNRGSHQKIMKRTSLKRRKSKRLANYDAEFERMSRW